MSKLSAILGIAALSCTTLVAQVPAERGSFRAPVMIEAVGQEGIAVFSDTNRDGSIDERFFLQYENGSVDAAMPTRFASALVEFEPGYARIIAGNDAIELAMSETRVPAWNPRGVRVWRHSGYGLSHSGGETGVVMPAPGARPGSVSSSFCDASTACNPDGSDEGGTTGGGGGGTTVSCDSGGPGSTSCSTSNGSANCTTSCNTGYYACCNNPTFFNRTATCKCVKY